MTAGRSRYSLEVAEEENWLLGFFLFCWPLLVPAWKAFPGRSCNAFSKQPCQRGQQRKQCKTLHPRATVWSGYLPQSCHHLVPLAFGEKPHGSALERRDAIASGWRMGKGRPRQLDAMPPVIAAVVLCWNPRPRQSRWCIIDGEETRISLRGNSNTQLGAGVYVW